jgi:hypothetical protein
VLSIQTLPALDAETVPSEVVVSARRADQASRRVRLQPPLVLAPVPDPVLGSQHPPASFAVQNGQVTHGEPECPRLKAARAPLVDEELVADLGFGERIDCHAQSIARAEGWNLGGSRGRV